MSTRTTISTHVLDTSLGAPAAGVPVTLAKLGADREGVTIAHGVTNADGRAPTLASEEPLGGGSYRLCFDVAEYFAKGGRASFYTEICIVFTVADAPQHYHVPLLVSPFGYSTYRGS